MHIAIVGAGFAGLWAAQGLASRHDLDVTLLIVWTLALANVFGALACVSLSGDRLIALLTILAWRG